MTSASAPARDRPATNTMPTTKTLLTIILLSFELRPFHEHPYGEMVGWIEIVAVEVAKRLMTRDLRAGRQTDSIDVVPGSTNQIENALCQSSDGAAEAKSQAGMT